MIGIVGGGISGLLTLHLLRKRGVDALLLEGAPHPGGVLRSVACSAPTGEDVILDLGPQRMRLTPGLGAIVEEVGLTSSLLFVRDRQPFTMYWEGRLHPVPMNFRSALTTPLISWRGKVRALADLITPPPRPLESVGEALARKLGPEIYERLAGPVLGGLYGSNPEEMQARHTLLAAMARTGAKRSLLSALRRAARFDSLPTVSFRRGMGELADRLAELHRDRIRFGVPVDEIRPAGGGFVLVAEGESIPVHEAILTLPAPEASRILTSLDPESAGRLHSLHYNPLAVVHLLLPEGVPLPEMGSGFKTTLHDPLLTRGVTAHGALFGKGSGRERVFTAFLGGMGREEVLQMSEMELLTSARADFRKVTGADPFSLSLHRTWMPAWDRSWAALDGLRLPAGIHLCSAFSGRPGIPGRLEEARRVAGEIRSG